VKPVRPVLPAVSQMRVGAYPLEIAVVQALSHCLLDLVGLQLSHLFSREQYLHVENAAASTSPVRPARPCEEPALDLGYHQGHIEHLGEAPYSGRDGVGVSGHASLPLREQSHRPAVLDTLKHPSDGRRIDVKLALRYGAKRGHDRTDEPVLEQGVSGEKADSARDVDSYEEEERRSHTTKLYLAAPEFARQPEVDGHYDLDYGRGYPGGQRGDAFHIPSHPDSFELSNPLPGLSVLDSAASPYRHERHDRPSVEWCTVSSPVIQRTFIETIVTAHQLSMSGLSALLCSFSVYSPSPVCSLWATTFGSPLFLETSPEKPVAAWAALAALAMMLSASGLAGHENKSRATMA